MAAQAPKPEGAAGRGGGGKEAGARDRSGDYAVLWEAEHGGRGGGGGGGGAGPSPGGVPVLPLEAAGKALSRARDRCQSALRQLSEAHAQLEQEQERSRCLAERRAHVRRPITHPPRLPSTSPQCPPTQTTQSVAVNLPCCLG